MTAPIAGAVVRSGAGRAVATRASGAASVAGKTPATAGGATRNTRYRSSSSGSSGSSGGSAKGIIDSAVSGSVAGRAADKATRRALPDSPSRRVLVAEFTASMAIVAMSPITDRHKTDTPGALMKRLSAVMAVYFVLALIATGGRGASRAASAFGGLILLVLATSNRDIFVVLAKKIGTGAGENPAGGPGPVGPVPDPNPDDHTITPGVPDGGTPPVADPGATTPGVPSWRGPF